MTAAYSGDGDYVPRASTLNRPASSGPAGPQGPAGPRGPAGPAGPASVIAVNCVLERLRTIRCTIKQSGARSAKLRAKLRLVGHARTVTRTGTGTVRISITSRRRLERSQKVALEITAGRIRTTLKVRPGRRVKIPA